MPAPFPAVILCIVGTLLCSCTFIRAITFQSDVNSFKREGSKVILEVYSTSDPNNCLSPVSTEVVPAGLIAAGVAIALNIAESEIQGYLDKKKQEFTTSYGTSVNLPFYYQKSHDKSYIFNTIKCIKLQRIIKEPTKENPNQQVVAFEWIASLIPNDSVTALRLWTHSLKLERAAARTDSRSHVVDIQVEVKIDVTTFDSKGEISTKTVANKNLIYPNLIILGNDDDTLLTKNCYYNYLEEHDPNKVPINKCVVSSWFENISYSKKEIDICDGLKTCMGITPVNIAVLVTEVGSGGENFGSLGKQIGDNKNTLNDAVEKAITDALTPNSK